MEIVYKLTDKDFRTYGGCQWGDGVSHKAPGGGNLCSRNWLHAYRTPLLATLLNQAHAAFSAPVLWECEAEVGRDAGDKLGCTYIKTLRIIPLPEVTQEQRVAFALLCAKEVYKNGSFVVWADNWLLGRDRTARAARAAWAAEWAAGAAEWAAEAAAWAAALAAEAAARAAALAARAAEAAARAAEARIGLDLVAISEKALKY